MNKKIAIIDPVGIKAGMDYYDISLLKGMRSINYLPYLFSNCRKSIDEITVFPFFKGEIHNKVSKSWYLFWGYIKSFKYCRRLHIKIVILHIFNVPLYKIIPFLIANLYRMKVVTIIHDIEGFVSNDIIAIRKLILNRLSDIIVVHNNYSYNKIVPMVRSRILQKTFIIKHGGYLDHIDQSSEKRSAIEWLKLSESKKYILFFGQIKKVKGLDILIKAMPNIHNDIHLIIAGKVWKDNFAYYDYLISEFKIQNRIIKIIRYISDQERNLLFMAADAVIIPYREVYQSGVLLMAMSYGLPVIASNIEGNREMISDKENGLLFQNGNALDLAEMINYLFSNNDLYLKISKNCLKYIEKEYSWKSIALQYHKIIQK